VFGNKVVYINRLPWQSPAETTVYPVWQVSHADLSRLQVSQLFAPTVHDPKGKKQQPSISYSQFTWNKGQGGGNIADIFIRYLKGKILYSPILRIVQSAWRFTPLADLFTQTLPQLLWVASSHMLQLMRDDWSYTYQLMSIARYPLLHLFILKQFGVKNIFQGFNTAARVSNSDFLSRETEYLHFSRWVRQQ